jgi:lysophospholipase L1-like esterase
LGSESAGGGGYRVHLFELAVEDNKNITFVGSSTQQDQGGPSGPAEVAGKPFPRANEGHSGWRILTGMNINSRVPSPALNDDPHIILIHIGTNDANTDSADLMAMNLGTLVDNVITNAPDSLIVVAKIVPFPGQAKIDAYNALVPGIVEERASAGKHVILADLNTGFDTDNFADVVHPDKAGYDFMAEKWYEIIKDYLPEAQ